MPGGSGNGEGAIKPVIRINASPRTEREKQRQARLETLNNKHLQGKITLDDIYEQNLIIIEILNERPPR